MFIDKIHYDTCVMANTSQVQQIEINYTLLLDELGLDSTVVDNMLKPDVKQPIFIAHMIQKIMHFKHEEVTDILEKHQKILTDLLPINIPIIQEETVSNHTDVFDIGMKQLVNAENSTTIHDIVSEYVKNSALTVNKINSSVQHSFIGLNLYPIIIMYIIAINSINHVSTITQNLKYSINHHFSEVIQLLNQLSTLTSWLNTFYQSYITCYNEVENGKVFEEKGTAAVPQLLNNIGWADEELRFTSQLRSKSDNKVNGSQQLIIFLDGNGDDSFPRNIFPETSIEGRQAVLLSQHDVKKFIEEISKKLEIVDPTNVINLSIDEQILGSFYSVIGKTVFDLNTSNTAIKMLKDKTDAVNLKANRLTQQIQTLVGAVNQYLSQFVSAITKMQQSSIWL